MKDLPITMVSKQIESLEKARTEREKKNRVKRTIGSPESESSVILRAAAAGFAGAFSAGADAGLAAAPLVCHGVQQD